MKWQMAAGSSNARTRKAPCSRWWERATEAHRIFRAPRPGIRPTHGAGDGLGKAGNRRLAAIDQPGTVLGRELINAPARTTYDSPLL